MTANTCGSCKYFGETYRTYEYDENGDEVVPTVEYHTCDLMQHLNGYRELRYQKPRLWPIAGVTDGSGYVACFKVSADFGCNQWKAK